MDFISIEHASCHSWPALEQIDREGWILRFAKGYAKRANSVSVLSTGTENVVQNVIQCEEAYNSRNLPCIFRLLSFNDNFHIETILDQRGYIPGDHSLVLIQDIYNKTFSFPALRFLTSGEWLPIYCCLNEKDLSGYNTHMEMISRIKHQTLFAVSQKEHKDVSCALGVLCDGNFGLFDMVTHPYYRNQGYGAELITGMLSWAKQQGATTAYLQVVSDNMPAVRLYSKLGYKPGYEYHYRIQNM